MSNHEITFNTNLSEPTSTRADFTYKITPTVISIVYTGLGQRPVTEDVEAVLRNIEHWHQGTISPSRSCAGTAKDFGTKFTETAKPQPFFPLRETDEHKASKSFSVDPSDSRLDSK